MRGVRDAINRNEFKIRESNVRNPGCNLFSDPRINGRLHAKHRTIRNGRRFGFQNINDSIPPAISCNYSATGLISRFKHENRCPIQNRRERERVSLEICVNIYIYISISLTLGFLFFLFPYFWAAAIFPWFFRFRRTKSLQEENSSRILTRLVYFNSSQTCRSY